MSVRLYVPDCLQADCFLIELTASRENETEEKKYILIDGGDRKVRRFNLLRFLKVHKVRQLDMLIVTHLHRDHIGRLDKVASRISVKKAQLVYSLKELEDLTDDRIYSSEMLEDVRIYRRLILNLKNQGTMITYSFDYERMNMENDSFEFMSYRLEKLYPVRILNDRSAVLPLIKKIDSRSSYKNMRNWLNKDSSVWLLKNMEKNLVIFAGDSFEENIKNPPQAQVLKISHHGRNSDFAQYFSREQLQKINPEIVILTTTEELFNFIKKDSSRNFIFDYEVICPSVQTEEIELDFE